MPSWLLYVALVAVVVSCVGLMVLAFEHAHEVSEVEDHPWRFMRYVEVGLIVLAAFIIFGLTIHNL